MPLRGIVAILVVIALVTAAGGFQAWACTATLSQCNKSCTISAPPGGSATCFTTSEKAVCIAYDSNDNEVNRDEASCPSGGGGSGGGGTICDQSQPMWWLACDPFAI